VGGVLAIASSLKSPPVTPPDPDPSGANAKADFIRKPADVQAGPVHNPADAKTGPVHNPADAKTGPMRNPADAKTGPGSEPAPAGEPAYPQALHLRPTAELAERVLLPGDPGRALALAQTLMSKPRMFNHHRGLWGYTGLALADGEPLTIQSTGMGGPSAAIVLTELIALGARRAIRVGTCGALRADIALGELVIARESICADGTSRALVGGERVAADQLLTRALVDAAPGAHAGPVVSVDLFYDDSPKRNHARDALAIEMECAALFTVGARAGISVACVLAVSDTFADDSKRTRIDDHVLLTAAESMGTVAVAALGV
jgi:uridine phosphorylase